MLETRMSFPFERTGAWHNLVVRFFVAMSFWSVEIQERKQQNLLTQTLPESTRLENASLDRTLKRSVGTYTRLVRELAGRICYGSLQTQLLYGLARVLCWISIEPYRALGKLCDRRAQPSTGTLCESDRNPCQDW